MNDQSKQETNQVTLLSYQVRQLSQDVEQFKQDLQSYVRTEKNELQLKILHDATNRIELSQGRLQDQVTALKDGAEKERATRDGIQIKVLAWFSSAVVLAAISLIVSLLTNVLRP